MWRVLLISLGLTLPSSAWLDFVHGTTYSWDFSTQPEDWEMSTYSSASFQPGIIGNAQTSDFHGGPFETMVATVNLDHVQKAVPRSPGDEAHYGVGYDFDNFMLRVRPVTSFAAGAFLWIRIVNAGSEPLTHLEVSYDARNESVAQGAAFIGSDYLDFPDVGIHFWTAPIVSSTHPSSSGMNWPEFDVRDSLGLWKTYSGTIDLRYSSVTNYTGDGPGLLPGREMSMGFWMDSPQGGGPHASNTYVVDNLRLTALALPEPGTSGLTLFSLLALTHRRKRYR
jgi:hypothetical protein